MLPFGTVVVDVTEAGQGLRNHGAHVRRVLLRWGGMVLPLVVFASKNLVFVPPVTLSAVWSCLNGGPDLRKVNGQETGGLLGWATQHALVECDFVGTIVVDELLDLGELP